MRAQSLPFTAEQEARIQEMIDATRGGDRLLRLPQVMEIVGLSKAMIYRLAREDRFPKPCKLGGVSTRWSEREVRDWCAAALASRAA